MLSIQLPTTPAFRAARPSGGIVNEVFVAVRSEVVVVMKAGP